MPQRHESQAAMMRTASSITMSACYEGVDHDGPHSPFHVLDGTNSELELWAFLVALCEYGSESQKPGDPKDAMRILARRSNQILAGGVLIKSADILIVPGCCCGLEDWIGLKGISQGGLTPWMGHDPAPWIDTSGPKAVVHSDEGDDNDALELDYAELERAVQSVSRDLTQFLGTLTAWLGQIDREQADLVGSKIAEWFRIERPEAAGHSPTE